MTSNQRQAFRKEDYLLKANNFKSSIKAIWETMLLRLFNEKIKDLEAKLKIKKDKNL